MWESQGGSRGPAGLRAHRVLLVDGRTGFRSALRGMLSEQPDIRIVAEARTVFDGSRVVAQVRPDVVLAHLDPLDRNAPADVCAFARSGVAGPHRLVVYSTAGGARFADPVLRSGARGFVLVEDRPALMVESVRAAACGDGLLSPALSTKRLPRMSLPVGTVADGCPLSAREVELVRAVALGLTNAEISRGIHISLSTVKHYLTTVLHKLHLRNRVEIATWAWRSGLMTASDPVPAALAAAPGLAYAVDRA